MRGKTTLTCSLKLGLFVPAAIFLCLMMAGCEKSQQQSSQAPAAGPPPRVAVATVTPEKLMLTTELPGRTTACRVAQIRPQVSGLIQKRLFTEGARVEAGQVLYQIDPATFEAAVDNAMANCAAAKGAAARAKAALQASISDKERIAATLNLSQINRKRYETLFEKKVVSAIQRDQAVTEAKAATASLEAAKAMVESNRQAVDTAQATIQQAQALLKTARINLSYTRITAPIPGRIGRSAVTEGAIVTAYQPLALTTIHQMDPMFVDVPQSTTELHRLRQKLKQGSINQNGSTQNQVRLILEDETAYPLEGTLEFQDITVEQSTGSIILRAVFPNPDQILLPGMFVRAVINEGTRNEAILIPQQAVSRDTKGNPIVLTVTPDNKVGRKTVAIDRAVNNQWLVSSGLSAGERLIVEGSQRVRPGATVQAVPFEDKPADPNKPGAAKSDGGH